jgi:Tfp pilus assembly protein PilE
MMGFGMGSVWMLLVIVLVVLGVLALVKYLSK